MRGGTINTNTPHTHTHHTAMRGGTINTHTHHTHTHHTTMRHTTHTHKPYDHERGHNFFAQAGAEPEGPDQSDADPDDDDVPIALQLRESGDAPSPNDPLVGLKVAASFENEDPGEVESFSGKIIAKFGRGAEALFHVQCVDGDEEDRTLAELHEIFPPGYRLPAGYAA